MSARSPWVELGRIGAPFGLAGWMHVSSFTDPPETLIEYPRWRVRGGHGEGSDHRVLEGRLQGGGLVVRLEGIEDRTAAACLTGSVVQVQRSELPPPGEREFYRADLIGLEVRNTEGRTLGQVAYFVDVPAGAVMVVRQRPEAAGRATEHWVLADPSHLLQVDLGAGRILVEWPAELE